MLIFKFLQNAKKNKRFYLNSGGNHWRDFTYIDDVVNICERLIFKKYNKNRIFNICSGKPIYIKSVVDYLSVKTKYKKISNIKKNNIEVLKTHGKNMSVLKFTSFKKFSNFYDKIDGIINWYNNYHKLI